MLVQVVLLRHQGRKLSASEVEEAVVHRGLIQVGREPGGRLGSWARVAYLDEGLPEQMSLHRLQITRWNARGIVLMGIERRWRRKVAEEFPQSWWCIPIGGWSNVVIDSAVPLRACSGLAEAVGA